MEKTYIKHKVFLQNNAKRDTLAAMMVEVGEDWVYENKHIEFNATIDITDGSGDTVSFWYDIKTNEDRTSVVNEIQTIIDLLEETKSAIRRLEFPKEVKDE